MSSSSFDQLATRLTGELHTGVTLRRLYATDASEYQEMPAGVVFPENEDDRRAITDNFPLASIPRRNTGYALDLLMDADVFDSASNKPFNLCKLIAGSEGTLFFATEIELDCSPLPPPHAALVCGHFASVNEALQANLLAEGGVQCGFCTPGMIMSATALLAANPSPTDEEIRIGLSGNLCRCTGYATIIAAVRRTAAEVG